MKLTYTKRVFKRGNSIMVVIPAEICEALKIKSGDMVKIDVEKIDV